MSGRSGRRWGWYRLADAAARQLVDASGVGRNDLVLDLGAGDGRITRHLVATDAMIVAFELHPGRAAKLRRDFADAGVMVVRADVTDLRLPRRPFQVVANPPFDGVSAILRRMTTGRSRLQRADLVLPRSVAERWATRLDRSASPWRLRVSWRLPGSAFTPRPQIDCCVAVIERRRP